MNSLIFSGRSNPELAQKICKILKGTEENEFHGRVNISDFPSGETYCKYQDNIRGKNVFIVQSTNNPNQSWMELFLLIHTARLASANKITAIIPYFSYSRQDRKAEPRSPISARLMLDMLKHSGVDRVVTVDIHNAAIQGFSSAPFDSLIPCNLLIKYFKDNLAQTKADLKKWIVAAPDLGSVKKVEKYSEALGLDFCITHKKRLTATKVEQKSLIGRVRGKNVLIIDDMSESLGTLSGSAKLLKEKGAKKVVAFVTHLPLTAKGVESLKNEKNIDKIITTDTIGGIVEHEKVEKISVAPILSEAISSIIGNKSISNLFEIKGF